MLSKARIGAQLGKAGMMGRGGRIGGALKGAARSGLGKAVGFAGVAIEGFNVIKNTMKAFDKSLPKSERQEAGGAAIGGGAGMAIGAVLGGPIGAAIGGFVGRKLGGYMGKNWDNIKKFGKNLGDLTKKGFSAGLGAVKAYYGGIYDLGKKGFDVAKEKIKEFGPKVLDVGKKIFMTITPIGMAATAFKKFKEALPAIKEGLGRAKDKFFEMAGKIGDTVGPALSMARDKAMEYGAAAREHLGNALSSVKNLAMDFGASIKENIGNKMAAAKEKIAALGAIAKERFSAIKTKVAEVAKALPGKISGALSKAGELHRKFVEGGGLMGKAKGLFTGLKELVVGRDVEGAKADGGGIYKSGTYLVGEEGPELVNLSRGSQVVPNDRLQGGLAEGQFGEVNVEPLVEAIMSLKSELQQIKKHTQSTSKGVDGIKIGSAV